MVSRFSTLRFGVPLLLLLTGAASLLAQNTIRVPADIPTIQAAIEFASNGDTVLVSPGTYVENLDFKGKLITVKSSDGPAATIIDARNGTGVYIHSGETRAAVLDGFTIQNAGASSWPGDLSQLASGIVIGGANPTILNNLITHNFGFGIYLNFGGALIKGNTISYTSTLLDPRYDFGCDYDDGGGIGVVGVTQGPEDPRPYTLEIIGNTIEYNVSQRDGGGISLNHAGAPTISNNIIRRNEAKCDGGGLSMYNGNKATITQNLIYENRSGLSGGGLALLTGGGYQDGGPINVFLTNNTLYGNYVVPNPSVFGAVYYEGSQIGFGGNVSQTGMFNNIIVGTDSNSAIACRPEYQYLSANPLMTVNNIIRNTKGPRVGGWCPDPTNINGNTSGDPQFVDALNGNFHLSNGSPGIDAGANTAPKLSDEDIEGNTRIQNSKELDRAIVDLGVYETAGTMDTRSKSEISVTVQSEHISYGQSLTMQATVASSIPVDSGTVSFLHEWNEIGQVAVGSDGTANFTFVMLPAGKHSVSATYNGTPLIGEAASQETFIEVDRIPSTSTLTGSATSVVFGTPVTLDATVTSSVGIPKGSVYFYGFSVSLGLVQLDESGHASLTFLPPRAESTYIHALYLEQDQYLRSYSNEIQLTVLPAATTTTLAATPTVALSGSNVSLSVAVQSNAGARQGTADLFDGSALVANLPMADGPVVFVYPAPLPGIHTVKAVFTGTQSLMSSESAPVTFTIQDFALPAANTPTLTIQAGRTGTASLHVTPQFGFVGRVSFSCLVPFSMTGATCAVTSPDITTAEGAEALLTVTTRAQQRGSLNSITGSLLGALVGFTGFLWCPGLKRAESGKRKLRLMIMTGAIVLCIALHGCGGGGGNTGGGVLPGTPAGSYTITVNASSGTASHMTSIVVQVQ